MAYSSRRGSSRQRPSAYKRTKAERPGSHIDFGGLELRLWPFPLPLFTGVRGIGILGSSPCASYGGIMPAVEEVGQPEKRVGKKEEHLWTSTRRCSTTRSIRRNSPPTSAAHYSPPT